MSSFSIPLILFCLNFFVIRTNCLNISSVDKEELWHLLLDRKIGRINSNEFHPTVSSNDGTFSNNDDAVNTAALNDKATEFPISDFDMPVAILNDDGVKVEYYEESKMLDNNLKSRFMDIFNMSVVDVNETVTADTALQNKTKFDEENLLVGNDNFKFDREQLAAPTVIAIDVFKPSDTEVDTYGESKKISPKTLVKKKPGQTSLVIVFDGTGSMENCLIQLRAGAKQIIDKFSDQDDNPIYNYIFVPFRDPAIDMGVRNKTSLHGSVPLLYFCFNVRLDTRKPGNGIPNEVDFKELAIKINEGNMAVARDWVLQ
ncbi:Hemicentin-1 [Pseudolycoriella hygida]|uniref:Hemicentin-1 n=1 Tax=Pseudolycoriella hygida TaxID=35572 RepID=A0A9Q0MRY6_9DIPT|nr:Hemicentin-1 [Pseudolycoriella hygida]